jgi:hypothetical protein
MEILHVSLAPLELILFREADLHSWGLHPATSAILDVLATGINS